jgi:glycerol uptake facilitator-like aquaporin
VGFVTVIGVLASLVTNISYWNWYGFPGSYTAGYITIQIIGFFVAGLVAAALLRRRLRVAQVMETAPAQEAF